MSKVNPTQTRTPTRTRTRMHKCKSAQCSCISRRFPLRVWVSEGGCWGSSRVGRWGAAASCPKMFHYVCLASRIVHSKKILSLLAAPRSAPLSLCFLKIYCICLEFAFSHSHSRVCRVHVRVCFCCACVCGCGNGGIFIWFFTAPLAPPEGTHKFLLLVLCI